MHAFVCPCVVHMHWGVYGCLPHTPCDRLKCCCGDEPNEEQLFNDAMQLLRKLDIEVSLHLCAVGDSWVSPVCQGVSVLLRVTLSPTWLCCAALGV